MRKRIHIERQVERLANSRTLEIIEGVFKKLENKLNFSERNSSNAWDCNCLYCRIHMAYTYVSMRYKRALVQDNRSLNTYYYKKDELKVLKLRLENMNINGMSRLHIIESKKMIGNSISYLIMRAMKSLNELSALRYQVDLLSRYY